MLSGFVLAGNDNIDDDNGNVVVFFFFFNHWTYATMGTKIILIIAVDNKFTPWQLCPGARWTAIPSSLHSVISKFLGISDADFKNKRLKWIIIVAVVIILFIMSRWYCIPQHQLHSLVFSSNLSMDSPATPQSAVPLPLNSIFPSSPLNGCDTPPPTLSMSFSSSASTSRHPYINTASMDLTGGGGHSMMEYGWYVWMEPVHGMASEHASIIKSL